MDHDDVLTHLQIADLARQWPHTKNIHDLAMAEIAKAEKAAREELGRRAKADADAKILKAATKPVEVPDPPRPPVFAPRTTPTHPENN